MPLDPALIKQLQAKKNAPRTGGGGRKKPIDYNDRSYKAWFALEHSDPSDKEFCTNPTCDDPHGKYREVEGYEPEQVIATVTTEEHGTVKMCRYCFTSRWLVKREEQASLPV